MIQRCPKGTRRNKKTGLCEPNNIPINVNPVPNPNPVLIKRCPTGTRRNKQTGLCEPAHSVKVAPVDPVAPVAPLVIKRCPKGTKRNKKTGLCEETRGTIKNVKKVENVNVSPETNKLNKALVIQNFMKRTKHARKALFLKTICSDSGVCIAFGKESESIQKFFNNFVQFDYATGLKRIGVPSNNGVITEITYKHRDYLAHAILKSSITPTADNLMYEYNVGNVLNKYVRVLPTFVETYGYYFYKNVLLLNKVKKNTATLTNLKKGLTLQENYDYKQSCIKPTLTSVLIQHIKNARTLEEMLTDTTFLENDLLYCLYQVYYTLSKLHKLFTHYDLHTSNVLLYEPVNGKYIHYHYETDTGVISFKSKYIAKIIDYGRSFVGTPTTNISKDIYDSVCAIPECNVGTNTCGKDKGYSWLRPKSPFFLTSSSCNVSYDLRLLHLLKIRNITKIRLHNQYLADKINKTKYGVGVTNTFYKNNGTIENTTRGYPTEMNNVEDAELMLRDVIQVPVLTTRNNAFYSSLTDKIGDLHIRFTSDMEFIPNP